MSIRKHLRTIAKARMAAMGVERVNRKMGAHWGQSEVRKLMRRGNGKKLLAKMRAEKVPNWRRVISGDLSKDGRRAQYAK